MRRPKPPTPRTVSATLRAAGFKALGDGDEGYEVTGRPGPIVRVAFRDWTEQWAGSAALERAAVAEAAARTAMAATLRRKGWRVEERDTLLVVREQLEASHG